MSTRLSINASGPIFMNEINKYHIEEHPVQRFMDDWNRSSAQQKAVLSGDWIVRPSDIQDASGNNKLTLNLSIPSKKTCRNWKILTAKRRFTA